MPQSYIQLIRQIRYKVQKYAIALQLDKKSAKYFLIDSQIGNLTYKENIVSASFLKRIFPYMEETDFCIETPCEEVDLCQEIYIEVINSGTNLAKYCMPGDSLYVHKYFDIGITCNNTKIITSKPYYKAIEDDPEGCLCKTNNTSFKSKNMNNCYDKTSLNNGRIVDLCLEQHTTVITSGTDLAKDCISDNVILTCKCFGQPIKYFGGIIGEIGENCPCYN